MTEDVHVVAARGDVRQLRLLIRKGRMDDTDEGGNTPLILAAKHNRLPAVNLLVDRKANINHANIDGDTALHVACQRGIMHVSVIRRLFEAGANIFAVNSLRETPISLITKTIKLARHPKIAAILEKRDSREFKKRKAAKSSGFKGKSTARKQSLKSAGTLAHLSQLNTYEANAEDVASFRQIWDVLTGNGNRLDPARLAPVFFLLNIRMTPADYTVFFDLLDVDQNGIVDFDDFYVSVIWRKLTDHQEMYAIDIPFDALDTCMGTEPPTGMISRSSYKSAEKLLGPILFADNDRDVNRILTTLIPNFATLAKMDANAGIDRKLFAKIVSGKHEFQAASVINRK